MSRNKRVKSSRSDSDGYISIRSNCVRSNRSSKVLTMNWSSGSGSNRVGNNSIGS